MLDTASKDPGQPLEPLEPLAEYSYRLSSLSANRAAVDLETLLYCCTLLAAKNLATRPYHISI